MPAIYETVAEEFIEVRTTKNKEQNLVSGRMEDFLRNDERKISVCCVALVLINKKIIKKLSHACECSVP